jgi:hypothetical protein
MTLYRSPNLNGIAVQQLLLLLHCMPRKKNHHSLRLSRRHLGQRLNTIRICSHRTARCSRGLRCKIVLEWYSWQLHTVWTPWRRQHHHSPHQSPPRLTLRYRSFQRASGFCIATVCMCTSFHRRSEHTAGYMYLHRQQRIQPSSRDMPAFGTCWLSSPGQNNTRRL